MSSTSNDNAQQKKVEPVKKAGKYVPPHLRNKSKAQPVSDAPPGPRRAFGGRGGGRNWSDSGPQSAPQSFGGSSAFGRGSGFGSQHNGARMNSRGNNRWKTGRIRVKPDINRRNQRTEAILFGGNKQSAGINFKQYDDIPVETSGDNVPEPLSSFEDGKFHEVLADNIKLAGYASPTPVQKHAIPAGVGARDIMACAQTGSGKTAAFLFPLIQCLLVKDLKDPEPSANFSRYPKTHPYGLILAPTRELATQIFEESKKFTYRTGLRPCVVYGGHDIRNQFRELERGCDLLVATPGRLVDMIERGRISLSLLLYLVFDEADRMLDMGFEPQIRHIVEQTDMSPDRQTMMFSATFPMEIQHLAQDFLKDYVFLAVGRVGSTTESITQSLKYAPDVQKQTLLMEILPECEGLTLIFVETKRMADQLEYWLCQQGINATSIHGDRTQGEREHALAMFRCGRCPVMVATDVAARGLDIPNVLCVINFDLPNNIDDYVHRIGRTGRAGNTGKAIGFANERNKPILRDLYDIMKENHQVIEQWFEDLVRASYSWGNRSGKKKKGRFGARDFRKSRGGKSGGGGGWGGGSSSGGWGGGGRSGGWGGGSSSGGSWGGKGGSSSSDAW